MTKKDKALKIAIAALKELETYNQLCVTKIDVFNKKVSFGKPEILYTPAHVAILKINKILGKK